MVSGFMRTPESSRSARGKDSGELSPRGRISSSGNTATPQLRRRERRRADGGDSVPGIFEPMLRPIVS